MNTLRYLHLAFGLVSLVIGLIMSWPLLTRSGPIDFSLIAAIMAVFIGLLNIQQSSQHNQNLTARLAGAVLLLASLLPVAALLLSSALDPLLTYTLGFTVAAVCALAVSSLLQQSSTTPASRAGRPGKAASNSDKPATASNKKREQGEVKWFNGTKGYGFITRDQGGDIFVHFRAIRGEGHRSLLESQRVSFIVERREKGLQAEDVDILD